MNAYHLGNPLTPAVEEGAATRSDGFCSYGSMLIPPPDKGTMNVSVRSIGSSASADGEDELEALLGMVPSRSSSSSGNHRRKNWRQDTRWGCPIPFPSRDASPPTLKETILGGACASLLFTRLLDLVGCCYTPSHCRDHISSEESDACATSTAVLCQVCARFQLPRCHPKSSSCVVSSL